MKKSDVKFVTGLDGLDFGYDIMPLRAGSPSSHDIVGKDLVYLAEAAEEMRNVLDVDMPQHANIDMTDRSLLAARPYIIAKAFRRARNNGNHIMTNGAPIGEDVLTNVATFSPYNVGDWRFQDHHEWWSGVTVSPTAFESNPDDFHVGAVAEYAPIMRLFRDSQRVKSCAQLEWPVHSSNITYTTTKGGGIDDPWPAGAYYHIVSDFNESRLFWEETGWATCVASGGTYSVGPFSDYGIPYTVRVYLLFSIKYYIEGFDDCNYHYYDVVRLDEPVSGGYITFPASRIATIASRIISFHGIRILHTTPDKGAVEHGEEVYAGPVAAACQIVRGSHTLYS